MNNLSGIYLGLALIGFVLLVVALVAILYRPAKRLKVECIFKEGTGNSMNSTILLTLDNVGKRNLKIMAPFIRFSHTTHSKLFTVKPELISCRFPRMLTIGEKLSCELELKHYAAQLQVHSFIPTHVKIIFNDSAGLDFESHTLDLKA
ncbi:MAG: hypothetical protein FJY07_02130 [Bacteroidetes bacterium]|nr:hypothetical protein [Bacteroidota bacterium]